MRVSINLVLGIVLLFLVAHGSATPPTRQDQNEALPSKNAQNGVIQWLEQMAAQELQNPDSSYRAGHQYFSPKSTARGRPTERASAVQTPHPVYESELKAVERILENMVTVTLKLELKTSSGGLSKSKSPTELLRDLNTVVQEHRALIQRFSPTEPATLEAEALVLLVILQASQDKTVKSLLSKPYCSAIAKRAQQVAKQLRAASFAEGQSRS